MGAPVKPWCFSTSAFDAFVKDTVSDTGFASDLVNGGAIEIELGPQSSSWAADSKFIRQPEHKLTMASITSGNAMQTQGSNGQSYRGSFAIMTSLFLGTLINWERGWTQPNRRFWPNIRAILLG